MRIAAKFLKKMEALPLAPRPDIRAGTALLLALVFALTPVAGFAADALPSADAPGIAAAPTAAANTVASTVATTATDAPKIIPPAGAMDSSAALAAAMPDVTDKNDPSNKGGSRGLAAAEEKITDTAKAVVKRLNATDNLTLDDLNAARQAVAKIDALIDIEKRLNELQKLRSERDEKSLDAALPASALSPMPMHSSRNAPMPAAAMNLPPVNMPQGNGGVIPASTLQPGMMGGGSLEVSRIIGSNGSYTAVVKTEDGQTRNVERGDKLAEGEGVAITSAGVLLEHNGSKRLIHVKNIETVFGYNP